MSLQHIAVDLNKFKEKIDDEKSLEFHETLPSQLKPIREQKRWNSWSELLLQKINEKASGYRWMHEKEYRCCEKINGRFGVAEAVLFAITGALQGGSFVSFMTQSDLNNNKAVFLVLNIVTILLIIATSIVSGLKTNGEYQRKEQQHKYISTKFYDISLEIQYQFTLDTERRDGDKEFLLKIINKFNDLLQLSLPISKKTVEEYVNATEKNDITLPINLGIMNNQLTNNEIETDINANINKKLDNEIERWLKNF